MIGDASINAIATFKGTFFFISLFEIGITAQSQAGKKKPKKTPTNDPKNLFLGISLTIVSSETKVSIKDEIKAPNNKNGRLQKILIEKLLIYSSYYLTIK